MEPVKIATKNLEAIRDFTESIKAPNITKELDLGQGLKAFGELNERLPLISEAFVKKGIIKNHEALDATLKKSVNIINLPFMTQLKMIDAVISMRKILAENVEILKSVSIPHMPLYRNILNSIDEDFYKQIQTVMEDEPFDVQEEDSDAMEDDLGEEESVNIARPSFFDAAIKINVYMTITDNHINSNTNVSEEEKKLWNKVIKPVLMFLYTIFITWAMGDTSITEMQIVKQFEKIVEVIEDYQYPIETTDIEIKTKEEL
ncbi:hypothetical protein GTNG_0757 [Geobacillus thermodenitrificans NG80-2]|uniref:Uncharacterized protein n=2 Tax=Geobacillus thermodenitrificans TaxID=33940 RepID=A4ILD3_GEOTN|nr:hypothetical protein GTNG_0757 [Geobacillus thermodenitrificans NG80-2]